MLTDKIEKYFLKEEELLLWKPGMDWKIPYCSCSSFQIGFGPWLETIPNQYKDQFSECVSVCLKTEFDSKAIPSVNEQYVIRCLKRIKKYIDRVVA